MEVIKLRFDTYKVKCDTLNNIIWKLVCVAFIIVALMCVLAVMALKIKISGSISSASGGFLITITASLCVLACYIETVMRHKSENITRSMLPLHKYGVYSYTTYSIEGNFKNSVLKKWVGNNSSVSTYGNMQFTPDINKETDKNRYSEEDINKEAEKSISSTEENQCSAENKKEVRPREVKINELNKVQGIDEIKEDVLRIVDSLVNPEKYRKLGARPTKGLILAGPPGTGKTMIAKAMAKDAGVNFIEAVGSDFIEKYVGVGAQRVRELFHRARQCKPAIVFIDEIDAVGGSRDGESNSEHIQTVNAFLSELDGFSDNEGILVIGATNRLDSLDSAFTRAGRFDLTLNVSLPDREGREKILLVHSKNKVLSDDIDLKDISVQTVGFSGAELENLLNESALIAGSKNQDSITKENIEDAFFKIIMKGGKKRFKKDDLESKIVAWHEAGHTLAIRLLTDEEVTQVTVVGSTSGAGGVTFRNPKERLVKSKSQIESNIMTLYAGRAAEEILLGSPDRITTGASADIRSATSQIKSYLELYGMGQIGLVDTTQFKESNERSLNEASEMSKKLYKKVLEVLEDNKDILEELADTLINKETLYSGEIDAIIGSDNIGKYIKGTKV